MRQREARKAGPRLSLSSDSRFSAPRSPQSARPALPHATAKPACPAATLPGRANQSPPFPRSLPERQNGDGTPPGPSRLQRDPDGTERKLLFFSGAPSWWEGGKSQISLVLETKDEGRIHSAHEIQDAGHLGVDKGKDGGSQGDTAGEENISQWFSNLAAR